MYGRRGSSFAALLIGGAVGAIVGVLYAPRAGAETRAAVSEKIDGYWGEGRDIYETGRTRVTEIASNVRPTVAEKTDAVREKIEDARERLAEQVAKSASTTREAVANAVPVVVGGVEKAADVASHGVAVAGEKVLNVLDASAAKIEPVASDISKDVPEV